jgi:hypothetical protein
MRLLFYVTTGLLMLAGFFARAETYYVDQHSAHPTYPFTNWNTAATNFDIVSFFFSLPDSIYLVTNGVYDTGGIVANGVSNRLYTSDKRALIKSVNGPEVTIIKGVVVTSSIFNSNIVRCATIGDRTTLSGFTIMNSGSSGVYCSSNSIVTNCIIVGCRGTGAGVNGGIVTHCVISNNYAWYTGGNGFIGFGGGTYKSQVSDSIIVSNRTDVFAAGAYAGSLAESIVANNTGTFNGGAIADAKGITNCLIFGNSGRDAVDSAGALVNSTIVSNSVRIGAVTHSSNVVNSIVYDNYSGSTQANWSTESVTYTSKFTNCCTIPMPTIGRDNFTNVPLFAAGANDLFALRADSPCINAGRNTVLDAGATNDAVGLPRISGGTVDTGAREFQNPSSVLSRLWAEQFQIASDGTEDLVDFDGDGMANWQEFVAGTNPRNAADRLMLEAPLVTQPGPTIRWQSSSTRSYFVERAVSMTEGPQFGVLARCVGQPGTTSFVDTNGPSAALYRVRVEW